MVESVNSNEAARGLLTAARPSRTPQNRCSGEERGIEGPEPDESVSRILVVEDEEMVRNGLSFWLRKRNFEVSVAVDLRSATVTAIGQNPDAILLDVILGPEDGLQLVDLLRKAGLNIPIVVLTAHAGPYDGFRAHQLGIAGLLEKPSTPDTIASALTNAIRSRSTVDVSTGIARATAQEPGLTTNSYVNEALNLIDQSFALKGLSLAHIARRVGVSGRYLGRLFRHEVGCSVVTRIHRVRVLNAVQLLVTTDKSVKVIAEECGYHGASELHKHFSKTYGSSPTVVRRRQR